MWQLFFLIIGTAPLPAIRLHRVTSKISDYIFEELFIYTLIFFRLAFCRFCWAFQGTKLKKILNLSHNLKWNTSSLIYKLHLIFLSILVSRDQSKWRANKNEHGKEYNSNPMVCSKSNKQRKKNLNPSWNHWLYCRTNHLGGHSFVQRTKIADSSEVTATKFVI